MTTLDVPGARLYYEQRGSGPLLLAIGSPMDSTGFTQLAEAYKQLNASFGTFAMNTLKASTHALASNDAGDATYNSIEGQIQSLTSQRDALAAQIKAALDGATFDNQPLNSAQVQSWLSQAQSLQSQAAALAGP